MASKEAVLPAAGQNKINADFPQGWLANPLRPKAMEIVLGGESHAASQGARAERCCHDVKSGAGAKCQALATYLVVTTFLAGVFVAAEIFAGQIRVRAGVEASATWNWPWNQLPMQIIFLLAAMGASAHAIVRAQTPTAPPEQRGTLRDKFARFFPLTTLALCLSISVAMVMAPSQLYLRRSKAVEDDVSRGSCQWGESRNDFAGACPHLQSAFVTPANATGESATTFAGFLKAFREYTESGLIARVMPEHLRANKLLSSECFAVLLDAACLDAFRPCRYASCVPVSEECAVRLLEEWMDCGQLYGAERVASASETLEGDIPDLLEMGSPLLPPSTHGSLQVARNFALAMAATLRDRNSANATNATAKSDCVWANTVSDNSPVSCDPSTKTYIPGGAARFRRDFTVVLLGTWVAYGVLATLPAHGRLDCAIRFRTKSVFSLSSITALSHVVISPLLFAAGSNLEWFANASAGGPSHDPSQLAWAAVYFFLAYWVLYSLLWKLVKPRSAGRHSAPRRYGRCCGRLHSFVAALRQDYLEPDGIYFPAKFALSETLEVVVQVQNLVSGSSGSEAVEVLANATVISMNIIVIPPMSFVLWRVARLGRYTSLAILLATETIFDISLAMVLIVLRSSILLEGKLPFDVQLCEDAGHA